MTELPTPVVCPYLPVVCMPALTLLNCLRACFIVSTGTGVPQVTTFQSREYIRTYIAQRGEWPCAHQVEVSIRADQRELNAQLNWSRT